MSLLNYFSVYKRAFCHLLINEYRIPLKHRGRYDRSQTGHHGSSGPSQGLVELKATCCNLIVRSELVEEKKEEKLTEQRRY